MAREIQVRIDCDNCEGRGRACGDCVVTLLLGGPPAGVEIDSGDRVALAVLADSGLVPPLRLQHGPGSEGVSKGVSEGVGDDAVPHSA